MRVSAQMSRVPLAKLTHMTQTSTRLRQLSLLALMVANLSMALAEDSGTGAPAELPAPPARPARAPATSPRLSMPARPDLSITSEDLRITRNIRDSLQREVMDSDPVAIRIETRKGAVTLTGAIKDAAERRQVDALVHGTPGAMTLSDRLQIP